MASFYSSVNEKSFLYPDMGDYYNEELAEKFLESVDANDVAGAAYYVEEPFSTVLGYHPEHEAFLIDATPVIPSNDRGDSRAGLQNVELNKIDGDTMVFAIDSIKDGGNPFTIKNVDYKNFNDYLYSTAKPSDYKGNSFKLRLVGIDAPEITHYTLIQFDKKDYKKELKKMTIKQAKGETIEVIYDKSKPRDDKEEANFIFFDKERKSLVEVVDEYNSYPYTKGSMESIFEELYHDGNSSLKKSEGKEPIDNNLSTIWVKVVAADTQDPNQNINGNKGMQAKELLISLLSNATQTRLVVDANQIQWLSYATGPYKVDYGILGATGLWRYVKSMWLKLFGENIYKYAGFNDFGQDKYKRFLGAIYVKTRIDNMDSEVWINAAKYIKAKMGDAVELSLGTSPSELDTNNSLSSAFKLWTYDPSKFQYADAFFELSKDDLDDRKDIQNSILNINYDLCKDYTVIIGDCLFMVPPTSIRMVSQSNSNRVQLLRSKGTMVKQKPNNDKIMEMTLYFNGDEGINGYPVKRKLPNGEETTFYMNGLRSLIAMFKLTPFLPIENQYINDALNIDAVSLSNIQIQTMPSYPKCLTVTLTLQQFKYRTFLNDLPVPNPNNKESFNKNMFSSSINYGVMRYYYQRLLQNGENIKDLDPVSDKYIQNTLGARTSLVPAKFKNKMIKFYIIDEVWLDTMLSVKEAAEKQTLAQVQMINETTEAWARDIGESIAKIMSIITRQGELPSKADELSEDSRTYIDKLNKELFSGSGCKHLMNVSIRLAVMNIRFEITPLTKAEFDNLIKSIYLQLGLDQTAKYGFKDGVLSIPIIKENNINKIDTNSQGYEIADFFAYRSGKTLDNEDLEGINNNDWANYTTNNNADFLTQTKDNAIDIDTLLSAKFKHYPLDLLVSQISISMGNIFSSTRLKAYDGYAPQYCGGEDSVIEFIFQTKDQGLINSLNALQEIATDYLIRYRKILNSWPIRIDCELTKLCGINEVLIESVDTATVPNYPGLYTVTCRMISVDRTMRNKEALNKLDTMNNAGATNKSGIANVVYKTYFDLNTVLSKTEVYPDLELPTIDELEKTGYKYIKYSTNRGSRVYPDPDFYFMYGYVYSSQMLKKIISDYFKKATGEDMSQIEKTQFSYVDNSTSQRLNVSLTKDGNQMAIKYAVEGLKEAYEEQVKKIENNLTATKEEQAKKIAIIEKGVKDTESAFYNMNVLEDEILSNTNSDWNVCTDIKCSLGNLGYKYDKDSDVKKELLEKSKIIINLIDEELKKPITGNKNNLKDTDVVLSLTSVNRHIDSYVKNKFKVGSLWHKILIAAGAPQNKAFPKNAKKIIKGIYYSAAMALSGESEYSNDSAKTTYLPKTFIFLNQTNLSDMNDTAIPYVEIADEDTGEVFLANSREQAIKEGTAFGEFQIRRYNRNYLQKFYNSDKNFKAYDFLDPYYNSTIHKEKFGTELSSEELKSYKEGIIDYGDYSAEAFNRIVLVWLKKLVEDEVYLNFFDLRRDETIGEYQKIIDQLKKDQANISAENKIPDNSISTNTVDPAPRPSTSSNFTQSAIGQDALMPTVLDESIIAISKSGTDMITMLGDYEDSLLLGKIFLPLICAVTHGDSYIYGSIFNRDAIALTSKTSSAALTGDVSIDMSLGQRNFRKMIRAFCSSEVDIADNFSKLSNGSLSKLESAMQDRMEKLWVAASEEPALWIMHSFHDMVVNDKRGRMARAFPTYYLLLVDEGREIGYWKLHDNFYNMSALAEIEVVKSRKIPADTARITMTNMFKTFSADDEDVKVDYETNIGDVFKSIFNPHDYFEKAELRRSQQMNIDRIKLKPGARIHLRMGYSGDATELPIIFNGVVAEVSTGEIMEIIAQGDGHELANPDAFSSATAEDLAELKNENLISVAKWVANFFTEGATPKQLINSILTTKSGGFTKLALNWLSDGRFYNDNMFGIVNFGEIDYKVIHKNGEIMQNIYEAEGSMPWTKQATRGSSAALHSDINPPKFTIELKDKSPWDVLNVCASSSLDYIAGIAPFGIRSTIFYGRPHYYYAYDYKMNDQGQIMERRKPYQQYHLIDSYTDIISNNILASSSDLKTCAVGIYKGPNAVNKTVEKKVPSPLWVDFDIYPEFQKTITVDTQMTWKGNKLGFLVYNSLKNSWDNDGGQKIAWRMAARALKDSIKDMYQGEVNVLGDPSIKPFDRIYIHDVYEDMNGGFEVEAVVHRLSVDGGYTTSIYADCISTIDNRYEQVGQMVSKNILGELVAIKAAIYGINRVFDTTTKPMLTFIAKNFKDGVKVTTNVINYAASFIREDDLIKYSSIENWSKALFKSIGMTSEQIDLWTLMDSLDKWKDTLKVVNVAEINGIKDVHNILENIVISVDKIKLDDLTQKLNGFLTGSNIKSENVEELTSIISKLSKTSSNIDNTLDILLRNTSKEVIDAIRKNDVISEKSLKTIAKIEKYLSADIIKASDSRAIVKELGTIIEEAGDLYSNNKTFIKNILNYSDDLYKVLDSTKDTAKLGKMKKMLSTSLAVAKGPIGAIVVFVAEFLIEYILTKSVYNWAENKLASFNVLQIYPLKRNSKVYIAGLDGNKGLVVGSATYNQQGVVDQFVNWAFKDRGPVGEVIKSLLVSDNMQLIVDTYYKKNNVGKYNSSTIESEATITSMLQSMAEQQVGTYSAYKSIAVPKRASDIKSNEAKTAYYRTSVTLESAITTNPIVLNELIPVVRENSLLEKMFDKNILKIAHTQENIRQDDTKIDKDSYTFETKQCGSINVHGINIGTKEKPIIDIPFLRGDAFQVFYKLASDLYNEIGIVSPGEDPEMTLYLLSATTAGSNSWNSTGYMFKFYISNCDDIEDRIVSMQKELQEAYVGNKEDIQYGLIQYKARENGSYEVLVSPRVIGIVENIQVEE